MLPALKERFTHILENYPGTLETPEKQLLFAAWLSELRTGKLVALQAVRTDKDLFGMVLFNHDPNER
jgi:hypothetical protein